MNSGPSPCVRPLSKRSWLLSVLRYPFQAHQHPTSGCVCHFFVVSFPSHLRAAPFSLKICRSDVDKGSLEAFLGELDALPHMIFFLLFPSFFSIRQYGEDTLTLLLIIGRSQTPSPFPQGASLGSRHPEAVSLVHSWIAVLHSKSGSLLVDSSKGSQRERCFS